MRAHHLLIVSLARDIWLDNIVLADEETALVCGQENIAVED